WAAPDAARLARDRIGEARDHARRGHAFPRAARMPAQSAVVRHVIEWDAAALEVGLTGGARDANGLLPNAMCRLEPPPLLVDEVADLRRWRRLRPYWPRLLAGQGRDCFADADAVEKHDEVDDVAASLAATAVEHLLASVHAEAIGPAIHWTRSGK